MCTVSFVHSGDKIIITSNRDEQVERPSIAPKLYPIGDKQILFPKDPRAGGTWYAADEHTNIAVLLNGAAERHRHMPPYRKSRGLIVLDIIGSETPKTAWTEIILDGIEPFTMVLFDSGKLFQMRWNGTEKETTRLDENHNYVWSSSTLYPKDVREKRAQWFYNFLDGKKMVSEADMYQFHRYTEDGNKENGLVINRNDLLRTLSITQTIIQPSHVEMRHYDLIAGNVYENEISIEKSRAN